MRFENDVDDERVIEACKQLIGLRYPAGKWHGERAVDLVMVEAELGIAGLDNLDEGDFETLADERDGAAQWLEQHLAIVFGNFDNNCREWHEIKDELFISRLRECWSAVNVWQGVNNG